jgi:hypothetical protein
MLNMQKAALLRSRVVEKQHELVLRADFDAMIDGFAGVVCRADQIVGLACAVRAEVLPPQCNGVGNARGRAERDG